MIRWVKRILWIPILALAAYGAYRAVGDAVPATASGIGARIEAYLRDRVTDALVGDLRFDDRVPTIHVLPVSGDPTGDLRALLEKKIDELGFVRLQRDASKAARILRELGADEDSPGIVAKLQAFFEPDPQTSLTDEEALDFGRRYDIAGLLRARVNEHELGERSRLEIAAQLLDTRSGEAKLPWTTYDAELERSILSLPYLALRIRAASPWLRGLVWLGVVVLLPLALASLAARVLERESNLANATLLLGVTLVDTILLGACLGFSLGGFVPVALLVSGAAAAFLYNYVILSKLESLRR